MNMDKQLNEDLHIMANVNVYYLGLSLLIFKLKTNKTKTTAAKNRNLKDPD